MHPIKRAFGLLTGHRQPRHTGTRRVSGLDGEITIRRDRYGVPYIDASTDHDAWFALGFCHAQDRGGQLEIIARTQRGTMAEVAGPDALPLDRLSRRIGFHRAGCAQAAVCDDDVRAQLQAYCDGVAAGFAQGLPRLPHEFTLLGVREPTVWTPGDVQGFFALLCFALASNWDMELLRLRILLDDGPEALRALDPQYPEHFPVSVPVGDAAATIDRLEADLALFEHARHLGGGSNAWAVAPDRTSTGRPILANDPHLNPVAPTSWYLASIRTPEWHTCGATFVGLPAMGVGHNGFAAWGLTAAHADNTDLFVEQVGADGRTIRQGDKYVPCKRIEERIAVKGVGEVIEDVLVTPRGPIVTPALDASGPALSMSATWLAARPHRGFYSLHRSDSFESFRGCFRQAVTSGGNMVYADVTGDVGQVLGLELPIRGAGSGNLPLPGWVEGNAWTDEIVPFDELPHAHQPEQGFVATANNAPAADGDGPFLGVDWLDGYRQAAIVEALQGRQNWSVTTTQQLQLDVRSLAWRDVRDVVLALDPGHRAARVGLRLLRSWDGHMTPDARGATVFAFFVAEVARRVVRSKAPNAAEHALGRGFTPLLPYNLIVTRRLSHLVRLMNDQPDGWFDHGWEAELLDALDAVIADLRKRFGRRPTRWGWGRIRPLHLVHPMAEEVPALAPIFNIGPLTIGGDASTIAQAAVDLEDPSRNPIGLATLRAVIDVGAWDESRFAIIHGQCGNPFSPHFDDQVKAWSTNRGIPIAWDEARVAQRTKRTLTLRPEGRGGA